MCEWRQLWQRCYCTCKEREGHEHKGPLNNSTISFVCCPVVPGSRGQMCALGKSGENSSRAFPDVWVTPEDRESPLSKVEPLASCMQ